MFIDVPKNKISDILLKDIIWVTKFYQKNMSYEIS